VNLNIGTLGGALPVTAAPLAAATSKPGTVDVFWQGTDDHLWHAYYHSGGWHGRRCRPCSSLKVPAGQPGTSLLLVAGHDASAGWRFNNSYACQSSAASPSHRCRCLGWSR
jgi:hypothetical protein